MEDIHAKEIPLVRTTVKIPGMRPRGSRAVSSGSAPNGDMNNSIGEIGCFLLYFGHPGHWTSYLTEIFCLHVFVNMSTIISFCTICSVFVCWISFTLWI